MEYVVTSNGQNRLFVLASERKEAMEKLMGPLKVVGELKGLSNGIPKKAII